jgi:hypothetical protein
MFYTSLNVFLDLEQVADLLDLATSLRIVGLNGYIIDGFETQGMSRGNVLLLSAGQALYKGNLHVFH